MRLLKGNSEVSSAQQILHEIGAFNGHNAESHHSSYRDKEGAARLFAKIFGLQFHGTDDHFAPVRVNQSLTFLFANESEFESHHYAFHVSDTEFDDIFKRVQEAGLTYGSTPWAQDDGKLNDWNGGRGVYFKDFGRAFV